MQRVCLTLQCMPTQVSSRSIVTRYSMLRNLLKVETTLALMCKLMTRRKTLLNCRRNYKRNMIVSMYSKQLNKMKGDSKNNTTQVRRKSFLINKYTIAMHRTRSVEPSNKVQLINPRLWVMWLPIQIRFIVNYTIEA